MSFFKFFEELLDVYPDQKIALDKKGLFDFIWACSVGFRGWLLLFTILTAISGLYWSFAPKAQ